VPRNRLLRRRRTKRARGRETDHGSRAEGDQPEHQRQLSKPHAPTVGRWEHSGAVFLEASGTYSRGLVDGDERDQVIRRSLRDNLGVEPLGTDHYLGLTRDEAERLAAAEGRRLVDRGQYFESRRANW
jgi:hypothetical protein